MHKKVFGKVFTNDFVAPVVRDRDTTFLICAQVGKKIFGACVFGRSQ